MSVSLPRSVDPARMVAQRRMLQGFIAADQFSRLSGLLANQQGGVDVEMAFGKDQAGVPVLELQVKGELQLCCQRTLAAFVWPVEHHATLALEIEGERLHPLAGRYESVACGSDGFDARAVVEDELILLLPVVPIDPAAPPLEQLVDQQEPLVQPKQSPFAVLADWRRQTDTDAAKRSVDEDHQE